MWSICDTLVVYRLFLVVLFLSVFSFVSDWRFVTRRISILEGANLFCFRIFDSDFVIFRHAAEASRAKIV